MPDDLEQKRETVMDWLLRGVDSLDSVDAVADLDALLAAVRSATWQLARAIVEEEIQQFGPQALLRQALIRRMTDTERHQADA